MNILALETTGAKASVAVRRESGLIVQEASKENLNHLRELLPMVAALLEKCKLSLNDINVIAVSEGPGSFTGIRIGVSTARALAQALSIPTIGVPTLQSFAYHMPEYKGIICPLFDARRSQVYSGAYRWDDGGKCCEVVAGGAYGIEELYDKLQELFNNPSAEVGKREITFFGDGVVAFDESLRLFGKKLQDSSPNDNIQIQMAAEAKRYQNAGAIATLAFELEKEGKGKPYQELKPVYMRKAEAERKLEAQRKLEAAAKPLGCQL